jgi:O-antigen ligase
MDRVVSVLVFLLLGQSLAFLDRYIYGTWEGKGADKYTQALNFLFLLASLWMFIRGFRGVKGIRPGVALVLAVPCYLLLSAVWSLDPSTTIRRGVEYLFVVLAAVGYAGLMDGDEFMERLGLCLSISAALSLLAREIYPAEGLQDFMYLRGIFSHKNVLGQFMAVGALASLHGLSVTGRGRLRNMGSLAVFLLAAVLSKSTTSILASLMYCGAGGLMFLGRKGGAARILALAAAVLLAPLGLTVAVAPDAIMEMFGKDPTLSGRTELWAYVWEAIGQRPLQGWGYYAFWSGDNPTALQIFDAVQWTMPQAHNAILELLLDTGYIGTAFMIFLWLRTVWYAVMALRTPASALAITTLLSCAGIALVGTSESVMVEPFQPTTLLFFATGLMCEKAVHMARRRRRMVMQPQLPAAPLGVAGET